MCATTSVKCLSQIAMMSGSNDNVSVVPTMYHVILFVQVDEYTIKGRFVLREKFRSGYILRQLEHDADIADEAVKATHKFNPQLPVATCRTMFRERRRIHVINPKLAAHRATEDTHAQGETKQLGQR